MNEKNGITMKIVLEKADIEILEAKLGSLPVFAVNVNQNMAIASAVGDLMKWLNEKVVNEDDEEKTSL
jgi:hypothetical protein